MRKNILKYLLLLVFVAFASCKTIQVAKFTSVEKLFQIKLNSSLEEVIAILGSKPYNILSSQVGGYTIFTYKYKFVERKVNPKLINSIGGETLGTEVYFGKEQTVYLFFRSNKLEAFITSDGRKNSTSLVILQNTLYSLTKATPAINYNAPITISKENVSTKNDANIISENKNPPKSDKPVSVINSNGNDIVVNNTPSDSDKSTVNNISNNKTKPAPNPSLTDKVVVEVETNNVVNIPVATETNSIDQKSDNINTPENNSNLADKDNFKIKKDIINKTKPYQYISDNPINNDLRNVKPKPSNIKPDKRFRIQLGAFIEKPKLENVPDLTTISDKGLIKYYSGNFKTYDEAKNYKESLKAKYKGAFIVSFENASLFRVQIGAFENKKKFKNIGDISIQYLDNGKAKYYTGNYKTYDKALIKKNELIQSGMVGVFIVEY